MGSISKKDGRQLYKKTCSSCSNYVKKKKENGTFIQNKQRKYKEAILRKRKNMVCEQCGFKAEDTCQLDVDHIDGDHDNNDPSNHQILCANCHRLKTKRSKDGIYKRTKE